jgi:hypothetical protein
MILFLLWLCFGYFACQSDNNADEVVQDTKYLHGSVKQLSDVIVHDIFSPPVASRIYAYACISAYETLAIHDSNYIPLAGQLNGFSPIPKPDSAIEDKISYEVAALQAFLQVGKALIFSEEKIDSYRDSLFAEFTASGLSHSILKPSVAYGDVVAQHILDWAARDNYKETRSAPKYAIRTENPAIWKPTPPGYFDGIEPSWRKIRTFVLDSSNQFIPDPPTEFSLDSTSRFYQEAMEVYREGGMDKNDDRAVIARFWDCNPYVLNTIGHTMFSTKKITPGGHWIGITGIACRTANVDFIESCRAYAMTSIALADAFISCWDEKYRSNLVRPETYINQYVDESWEPLLQTPPFPEHTSGHSVISTAAAETLTRFFGEPFHFVDSVEVEYGLPIREFDSFREASSEAALSRLYGGIHYRPAIDYGVEQGRKVGQFIVKNVKTRKG